MAGEKDLRKLLAGMSPQLNEGQYVFTVAPDGRVPAGVRPVVTVAEALARSGISCNVVAGFHHDHLFVPHADASRARDALELLTR